MGTDTHQSAEKFQTPRSPPAGLSQDCFSKQHVPGASASAKGLGENSDSEPHHMEDGNLQG